MGVTVALGDSLTYGYPYSPGSSWVSLAAKKLGITIYNRGINGDTSLDMLARLEPDVLSLHPDIVIILAGSNDALGYKGVIGWRETKKALLELKSLIEAAGGKVILCFRRRWTNRWQRHGYRYNANGYRKKQQVGITIR